MVEVGRLSTSRVGKFEDATRSLNGAVDVARSAGRAYLQAPFPSVLDSSCDGSGKQKHVQHNNATTPTRTDGV